MLAIVVLGITSCDDDDPEPVNDPELITTLIATFTNTNDASNVVEARFQDIDGPGGNDPITSNPTLMANSTYNVTLRFLNESETPVEDKTVEISNEDEEHQVFYIVADGLNLTYTYGDQDDDENPLGISGQVTTTGASTGNLTITLIHEPNKSAAGVSEGDPTNAGGDTDISVTFSVTIQ